MSTNKGYIFPDPIDPEETACFKVYVPKHSYYLAAFWRAYEYFTQWSAWQRDPEHKASEVAALWKTCYELARSQYETGEGCEMIPEFRLNDETCLLEVNCNESDDPELDNWQPVVTTAFDPRSDGDVPEPFPSGALPEGQSGACVAADSAAQYFQNAVNGYVEVFVSTGVLGLIVAGVIDFITDLINVARSIIFAKAFETGLLIDPGTLEADYAGFDWDVLKCILADAYAENGSMSEANFLAMMSDFNDRWADNQIWTVVSFFAELLGFNGMTTAALWSGSTEADCSDCADTWHYEIDFLIESGSAIWTGTPATWFSGQGWKNSGGSLYLDADGTTPYFGTITHVKIEYNAIGGTDGADAFRSANSGGNCDLSGGMSIGVNYMEWSAISCNAGTRWLLSFNGLGGDLYITKLIVDGVP